MHEVLMHEVLMHEVLMHEVLVDQKSCEIHERALSRAKRYLLAEAELIDSLAEVDDGHVYLKFEKSSLYQYACEILNLSEDVSCNLIAIMRKSRQVPELKEAIRAGLITASKARKIVPVITAENKTEWLELAATNTSRVIEKVVATENPKLATQESLKYTCADRLELVLGVSEEWETLLKSVKDVASQKAQRAVSTEEALKLAMAYYLDRNDPLKKAEQAEVRRTKQQQPTDKPLSVPGRITRRQPLRAELKHLIMRRDRRQCTHTDLAGRRCGERRWIDVHHLKPVADGGANELPNLQTLCRAHHELAHEAL